MKRMTRSFWAIYGLAFVIAVVGFAVACRFIGPPPPKTFGLAAGPKGGAYYAFAQRYAAFLAQRGIRVEVLETAGTVENLRLLQEASSGVDVAIVQGGVADGTNSAGLIGLGSVCLEPLWVFLRDGTPVTYLRDLENKHVAVGPEGSGTRPLALTLLAANGVNGQNATLLPLSGTHAFSALVEGRIDALMTVASVDAESVRGMLLDSRVVPFSFLRADAYVHRFRFLSAVRLPKGVIDLARNRPTADLVMVSPAATLVARGTFHPALVDLMLQAAANVHASGDLLSDPGQFPSPLYLDVPISRDAQRYFKYGPPFLQRFLPFWLATTIERIKVLVVPVLMLLLPLFKTVPPTVRWRTRGKITRWYRQLYAIDARIDGANAAQVRDLLKEIEQVEREVLQIMVPLGFADQLYNLRSHIELVRKRILSCGQDASV
jgi:TRAP-type uncharacterized transport system substrate-binding protein